MTKHFKNIIDGARQVLVLSPSADYVRPSKSDFKKDVSNLRRDTGYIVRDLKNNTQNTQKYGK
jgi:hypothetical protein